MVCTSAPDESDNIFTSRVKQEAAVQQSLNVSTENESIPTIKEDENDEADSHLTKLDESSRFLPQKIDTGDSTDVGEDDDDMKVLAASVATFNPSTRPRIRSSSLSHHYLTSNTHKLAFNEKQREMRDRISQTQKEAVPPVQNKDVYELLPPDGGWGWVVLLGTVIVNTLIPGLIKSFGVLFVEFITVFKASPSEVAWIPALTFALYNLLGKSLCKMCPLI